ncbi:MAG: hypothetical protein R3C14_43965 [Caldilineaceae bacterium]
MSTLKDRQGANPRAEQDDDFGRIKGIGPVRQRILKRELNLHTFHELAACSADTVGDLLKKHGHSVSPSTIEEWRMQASTFAAEKPSLDIAIPPAAPQKSAAEIAGADKLSGHDDTLHASEPEWEHIAAFVVEFQQRDTELQPEQRTLIHHLEPDKTELYVGTGQGETWPGMEGTRLCQWMVNQVQDQVRRRPINVTKVMAQPPAKSPAMVEITRLDIYQPPNAPTPILTGRKYQPLKSFVWSIQPLVFGVTCKVAGFDADQKPAHTVNLRAEFYTRNLNTGERKRLLETGAQLHDLREIYSTFRSPEITLAPGAYRLTVKVILQNIFAIIGFLEIPLLQVL